ncbi:hypothetical protein QUG64_06415 [Acinetobacter lwoffii]|uniref:Uncharacterized protein n=1 Tax=Acinetobacter lwoffii NCTC 5866 = CIP 64.10 = NIPH 512 TaxID=981327 RepID=A0ABP2ZJD7_ACILW|nr:MULTISPECIES: hypothetical protein [Acinetobacter]ENU16262.1 hypothetical protein F995_01738 [Acinetobacter sp. CIP A162]ESJ95620.1 hypothetical protein P800_00434 [Acinetobacter lwoffii NCTC 5866 = CIP 64.10 = NIPH 512]QXB40831.1 hypothetical protein I6L23_01950 [Acinetobacter lwoffii]SUU31588.1 Uncharacterised protein [Acinetobacter lwoffii]VFQ37628.1 Uncharacterised protein [Acinetobacter lwoffii]
MDHSTNANVFSASPPRFTIQKFVGELKVIDSGVLHCESSKPIRFLIDDFELVFNFINNDAISTQKIETKAENNPGLKLKLTLMNFNNPLGSGLLDPVQVVFYKGREIYVSFFTIVVEGNRQFNYSILSN